MQVNAYLNFNGRFGIPWMVNGGFKEMPKG